MSTPRVLDFQATVWITGATSGIGLHLAQSLLRDNHRIIATGRRLQPLQELASEAPERVTIAVADTTQPDDLEKTRTLFREQAPVQMAILNAGTCEYVDIAQFDASVIEHNITTNLIGTARSVETVLPALRKARRAGLPAHLVIVSSSAWWFPFGRAEGYGASKAGLTYFAHALRADLAAEGITVTVVSPGFVKTPLTDRNDFPMPFMVTAEDAANRILKGLKKGRTEIHFPKRFTYTLKALNLLPQCWIDSLAARMTRKSQETDE
ncbi:SDR family NAD(P)-dependent oxidoreductase [Marinobacter sp. V034]|uniref:SDR family NAD(P)-dependent oxidoreductase n=1 Tax=Marinobacter sp. V034 TaxID=3459610 RepID=UPI004045173A